MTLQQRISSSSSMDADKIQIIFDGPPSHESGRFVEVEQGGKSINFGAWKQGKGGYWILELPLCLGDLAILEAAQGVDRERALKFLEWVNEDEDMTDDDGRRTFPLMQIRALVEALPGQT